jgi:hypothetical protein
VPELKVSSAGLTLAGKDNKLPGLQKREQDKLFLVWIFAIKAIIAKGTTRIKLNIVVIPLLKASSAPTTTKTAIGRRRVGQTKNSKLKVSARFTKLS